MADGAQRLSEWGIGTALPFWRERGWDARHGGFLESLDLAGNPVDGDVRRVRVQARQIHVFALAHAAGWVDALDLAEEGFALLKQRACSPDARPGWVHTLHPDGSAENPARDLYDHAFILLALSSLYRVTGKSDYLTEAAEVFGFLDGWMRSPAGGFEEAIGAGRLPRRQNPHMHLFEALLDWHQTTGDPVFLERAKVVKALFDRVFFDAGTGVVREYFEADWSRIPGPKGETIEPGHMCEWIWLLDAYARQTGEAFDTAGDALYEQAIRRGCNPQTGLLYAEIAPDGSVTEPSSRIWTQTEWVRAAIIRKRHGEADADAALATACERLFRYHLDPAMAGGWIDKVDADGKPLSKVMPASILYHLFGCLTELSEPGGAGPEVCL